MTKQRQIAIALRTLIQGALPDAEVRGFDIDGSPLEVVPADGMVTGLQSDPGDPEVYFSPLTYNYNEDWPVEVAAGPNMTLDDMLIAIGGAIRADRTLGGLCDWIEATAPVREDRTDEEVTMSWGEFSIVTLYFTPDPLA